LLAFRPARFFFVCTTHRYLRPSISMRSAGLALREALKENRPLQIVGTINAYCAMLAEHAGNVICPFLKSFLCAIMSIYTYKVIRRSTCREVELLLLALGSFVVVVLNLFYAFMFLQKKKKSYPFHRSL
jgi:hypothetical protein